MQIFYGCMIVLFALRAVNPTGSIDNALDTIALSIAIGFFVNSF